jgi:hypothetical protein
MFVCPHRNVRRYHGSVVAAMTGPGTDAMVAAEMPMKSRLEVIRSTGLKYNRMLRDNDCVDMTGSHVANGRSAVGGARAQAVRYFEPG